MRSVPRPSVMAIALIATLALTAMPATANGPGPIGCVNVTASLNGDGLFLWYGVVEAIGVTVGASPSDSGGATFGLIVFPEACTGNQMVDGLLTSLETRASTTSSSQDPASQLPMLP